MNSILSNDEREHSLRVTREAFETACGGRSWLLSLFPWVPVVALIFVTPMTAMVIGIAVVAHLLVRILHDTSGVSALKQKEHDLW